MPQKMQNLIGLAGQSCAGKNIVADFLEAKGFFIIDADKVAHTILEEYQEAIITRFSTIAEQHGLQLRGADGSLDRKVLSSLLFSEEDLLAEHEAFILPKIEERIRTLIQMAQHAQPRRPIVLNAPTLHKTSLISECAFILYIQAPFIIRLIRGKRRDRLSWRRLIARFLYQKDFLAQYLLQNADIVKVKNAHSVHSLQKKIEQVMREKGF